jgi:hypothetical protein
MYLLTGTGIQIYSPDRDEQPVLPDPGMAVPTMHENYRRTVTHPSLLFDAD